MDTTAIYFSQTLSANLTRSSAVKNPDMKNPALSAVIHTIVLPIAASSLIKMSAVQPATVTFQRQYLLTRFARMSHLADLHNRISVSHPRHSYK